MGRSFDLDPLMWGLNLWYGLWYTVVPSSMCLSTMWIDFVACFCPAGPWGFHQLQRRPQWQQRLLGLACLLGWLLLGQCPGQVLCTAVVHPVSIAIAEGESGAVMTFLYGSSDHSGHQNLLSANGPQTAVPYRLEGWGPIWFTPRCRTIHSLNAFTTCRSRRALHKTALRWHPGWRAGFSLCGLASGQPRQQPAAGVHPVSVSHACV